MQITFCKTDMVQYCTVTTVSFSHSTMSQHKSQLNTQVFIMDTFLKINYCERIKSESFRHLAAIYLNLMLLYLRQLPSLHRFLAVAPPFSFNQLLAPPPQPSI